MPIPQLFGAPQQPDTGGVAAASIGGAQRSAELRVQAAQGAAQMVLGALTSAMELRARKDAQMREIEAAQQLERLRQSHEDRRQRMSERSAMLRTRLTEHGSMERARLQAGTEMSGNIMREFGANARSSAQLKQSGQQFDARMGFERERAETEDRQYRDTFGLQRDMFNEQKETNRLLNAGRAEELAWNHELHRKAERAEEFKQMAQELALTGGFQRDPTTGAVTFDPSAIQSMIQTYTPQAGAMGPMTSREDAASAPGAAAGVGGAFMEMFEPQNKLGVQSADIEHQDMRAGMMAGGKYGAGATFSGTPEIGREAIEKLAGSMTSLEGQQALHALAQTVGAGNPVFYREGQFQQMNATPSTAEGISWLDRASKSSPSALPLLLGVSADPYATQENQLTAGSALLRSLQLGPAQAPQQAAPQSAAPQRAPQQAPQPQAQPAPVQQAPAQPQALPQPTQYSTQDLDRQRVEGQIATDEERTRNAMDKFKSKYGIGMKKPEDKPKRPKLESGLGPDERKSSIDDRIKAYQKRQKVS